MSKKNFTKVKLTFLKDPNQIEAALGRERVEFFIHLISLDNWISNFFPCANLMPIHKKHTTINTRFYTEKIRVYQRPDHVE